MARYLFPHSLKIPGVVLFVISLIGGILYLVFDSNGLQILEIQDFSLIKDNFFGQSKNNLTDEILSIGILVGGILTGFTKHRIEDEYIAQIRLESLLWAVYINSAVLILSILLISGIPFLQVMVYNMFTVIIIFIIRFNWILFLRERKLNDK
ncbi:MAG: hypothetical protein JXR34_10130 [Bacteroidales bacterium]|nr:hypothetical protein [Bacteroidales bacterium]